jgi:hypothetical protein
MNEDIYYEIMLNLDYVELQNFVKSNKTANLIYHNKHFQNEKQRIDNSIVPLNVLINLMEKVKLYNNIIILLPDQYDLNTFEISSTYNYYTDININKTQLPTVIINHINMDTHSLYKKQELYIQNDLLYNYIAKILSTAGTIVYKINSDTIKFAKYPHFL